MRIARYILLSLSIILIVLVLVDRHFQAHRGFYIATIAGTVLATCGIDGEEWRRRMAHQRQAPASAST